MSDRILVATRKGLFNVERNGSAWRIGNVDFLGAGSRGDIGGGENGTDQMSAVFVVINDQHPAIVDQNRRRPVQRANLMVILRPPSVTKTVSAILRIRLKPQPVMPFLIGALMSNPAP